ncbi:hypothetical protein ACJMK2_026842 [Sinanodonta woodiana]|uniref:Uncharacterized protein n=1 Tax=Sinanodonta woodiana TaxID=1069815 RepID=A0ABD3XL16_SINWO
MAQLVFGHLEYSEFNRPKKNENVLSYGKRFLKLKQGKHGMQKKSNEYFKEVEGVETSNLGNFPFSAFKMLGSFQIGAGVICIVLGIIDLCLYLLLQAANSNSIDTSVKETITSLTIISTPVWCGLWFVVCGSTGTCMSSKQRQTLSYFKLSFLILSILCAVMFGPACCAIEVVIAVLRAENVPNTYQWCLPILISFFAFNEIIFAFIASAICCCCSPINQTRVHVVIAKPYNNYNDIEKRPLDSPEVYESVPVNKQEIRQPKTNYDNFAISRPPMESQTEYETGRNGGRHAPHFAPEDKHTDYHPRNYSDSYNTMKKLAMPMGRKEW